VQFLLPVDCVIAKSPMADAEVKVCGIKEIPEDWMGLDIGPATISLFSDALQGVKTIVWNGPLGMFELAPFNKELLRWPLPWQTPERSPLSAAVTRIRQFTKPVRARRCLISPPAAARFWNCWKEKHYPELPRWKNHGYEPQSKLGV